MENRDFPILHKVAKGKKFSRRGGFYTRPPEPVRGDQAVGGDEPHPYICFENLDFENLNLFRISCFEFRI